VKISAVEDIQSNPDIAQSIQRKWCR